MGLGGARMSKPLSLQLETLPIEIDGSVYPLCINMNVLEKLQNGPGEGEIGKLFDMPSYLVVFQIFEAMIEDACEADPDLPVPDPKRLRRLFSPAQLAKAGIFRMFSRAMNPDMPEEPASGSGEDTEPSAPDPSGN